LAVSIDVPLTGSLAEPTIDLTSSEAVVALERVDRSSWVNTEVETRVKVIDERTGPIIDLTRDEPWTAGYHRSAAELEALERTIVSMIDPELAALSGLVLVEVDPASPLSDFTRTKELEFGWEDLPVYMKGYEHATPASLLVDFDRPDGPRIVFAGRSVRGHLLGPQSCGSQVIDTVEHVTPAEVRAYYGIPDLHACFDITTAYRVRGLERSRRHNEYFAHMFMVMSRVSLAANVPYFMAYMNPLSKNAVDRLGLPMAPLCGKEIVAPLVEGYEYNAAFQTIAIAADEVFRSLYDPHHELAPFVEPFRSVNIPVLEIRVPPATIDLTDQSMSDAVR
jgi:hypothetical protein